MNNIPPEVIESIKVTIDILNENYGIERTAKDLGGYVSVVDKVGIDKIILKITVDLYRRLDDRGWYYVESGDGKNNVQFHGLEFGEYKVEATYDGKTIKKEVTIEKTGNKDQFIKLDFKK